MADFLALTSRGLAEVLHQEILDLGFTVKAKTSAGVLFDTNWEGCYLANLKLRTASRVVKPILDFPAYQPDELYHNVLKHDFTKYIDVHDTFTIDANVRESSFRDQRFVAMKVKDAIADQFREKFGERPNIDNENPTLRVLVKVVKNQVSLAIDTSGETLSMRGYRSEAGEAPLREHLAAGLLQLAGWKGDVAIVDPMCGSGTFLIEAAMMHRNIAPGTLRKKFGFQSLKGFDPEIWDKVVTGVLAEEKESNIHFYGFDKDSRALDRAKRNAERAGVDADITFSRCAVDMLETPPCEKGILVVNPPYGERMGVTEELKDVYKDLAYILKRQFKGWTCYLLSGNEILTGALRLKASKKFPVYNGSIDCRWLEYKVI